ncbi:MAG: U32 family peptidase [Candidatus Pacebacteria bacterium]|nr:U32 family peptidase [Candidatus Paceibacterota bacterium]
MKKSKIKIAVGIDSLSDIEPLVKAGANEFFCGILGRRRLNGRPNISRFNLDNLEELKKAIKICHFYNKEIWLALNAFSLTTLMAKEADNLFHKAVQSNIDGVILADLELLSGIAAGKPNVKIAISTLLPKFNLESINFFKQFRFNRLILDRQMTLGEIRIIDNNIKNIELETFAIPNCRYVNAFCGYEKITGLSHGKYMRPCTIPLGIKVIPPPDKDKEKLIISHLGEIPFKKEALLCSTNLYRLFYFNKLRNKLILKFDFRGYPLLNKVSNVGFFSEILNFLFNNQPTHEKYVKWANERFSSQIKSDLIF